MNTVTLPFLLALAAKGTILLVATAVAVTLARRARASVRHALWAAGLTGLLLIPLLSVGLPRWEVVSLPRAVTAPPSLTPSDHPQGPAEAVPSLPSPGPAPAAALAAEVATQAPREARVATGRDFTLAETVILMWAAGAGLILGWLVLGHFRVRSIVRAASPTLSPQWLRSVEEALQISGAGVRVEFRETAATMPMASGVFRPVVLVPAAGMEWTPQHRRDVILHELAHVRRRDCLTHLASRIACALHWFNPLAWIAARQARVEREHACDDAVLAAGALPSSYAQALLDTARRSPAAWATAAASLTMARPSHLSTRLLAVLDERRRRGRLGKTAFSAASFGTLALLLPVAALAPARDAEPTVTSSNPASWAASATSHDGPPGLATTGQAMTGLPALSPGGNPAQSGVPCRYSEKGPHRTVRLSSSVRISGMGSTDDGKGNRYVAWTGADCSVVVHVRGEPVFTTDEADVAEFRGSGRFTVTHAEGSSERIYDVKGDGTSLTRSYTVEGTERPVDDAVQRWKAALVLQFIRQSAYQAEARAQRILQAKGVPGLLEEIDAIPSNWARGRYYLAGIAARQGPDDLRALLDHAGTHLDSDYEKGRVLSALPGRMLGQQAVRTSYLAITRGMESDYEKAKALLAVSAGGLDAASTQTALQAATTVTSSYERSRVLVAVVKTAPAQGDLDPLYFDAVSDMESDYEKAKVLTAYAQHAGLDAAGMDRLYLAMAGITSSYELANTLIASIVKPGSAAARCEGYLAAATKIDSDHDKARAMAALTSAGPLGPSCARQAAVTAGTIQSSNDRARVLIDYVARGFLTDNTRADFFGAARGLGSSYDLRRVLVAVLAQSSISNPVLVDLLGTAGAIDSDNDLASVLVTAAGTGMIVESVRSAYLRAAEGLSSDYERKRALTAIGAR
jgi:beta-lactamase regulating signal transducer with metallopeptidase domain